MDSGRQLEKSSFPTLRRGLLLIFVLPDLNAGCGQCNGCQTKGHRSKIALFFLPCLLSFCIGRQINKEQALLGGIQLIVSEELRWNVNVQHARSREGETDEAWERICLCLSLFFPPPPFLLSARNGHCRRYILVLASHNSEIFNPIFWSRVNMSNCWRVDQGFVLFPECESRCRFLPWRQIRWVEVKLILAAFYLDWIMPPPNMAATISVCLPYSHLLIRTHCKLQWTMAPETTSKKTKRILFQTFKTNILTKQSKAH